MVLMNQCIIEMKIKSLIVRDSEKESVRQEKIIQNEIEDNVELGHL